MIQPLPLALTMGEPAGIGGDIALKAWTERNSQNLPAFFLIDAPSRLGALAERLGLDVPVQEIASAGEAVDVFANALPVLPIELAAPVTPGQITPANGRAVLRSIERAVALVQDDRAGAIITNPIHKAALYQAGFEFPGHTEYLSHLDGGTATPVMMLACRQLRVVLATVHVSLKDAVESLSAEGIIEVARITNAALKRDFAIAEPRIAVAGLNPHAGEGGAMGWEEADIIRPAIEALQFEGIAAFGPLPPDTMFSPRARATYDAALCMYHDQGLIPLKTLDFDGGVNITLGLSFVRTSPDHGTALDISGTGEASEKSLIEALKAAQMIAANRNAS